MFGLQCLCNLTFRQAGSRATAFTCPLSSPRNCRASNSVARLFSSKGEDVGHSSSALPTQGEGQCGGFQRPPVARCRAFSASLALWGPRLTRGLPLACRSSSRPLARWPRVGTRSSRPGLSGNSRWRPGALLRRLPTTICPPFLSLTPLVGLDGVHGPNVDVAVLRFKVEGCSAWLTFGTRVVDPSAGERLARVGVFPLRARPSQPRTTSPPALWWHPFFGADGAGSLQ